jgi:hypothetical protein
MPIQSLHIGMHVRHPQYGVGEVKSLTELTAEISFDDARRTIAPASSELTPAEPTAAVSELQVPLSNFIRETVHAVVEALGLEKDETIVQGIANRWENGTLVLRPADASVQAKEVPLETFFHKIVMIRNNLRVLEQKVNASDKLTDADKVDLQQYITRCYGSLTTFNILFKNKEDQFSPGPNQRSGSRAPGRRKQQCAER